MSATQGAGVALLVTACLALVGYVRCHGWRSLWQDERAHLDATAKVSQIRDWRL